jgi:protein-tyrosine phosphatase
MTRACDSRLLPFNWRDVGSSLLPEDILPAGRLLRSGHVDLDTHRWAIIGRPQVIVNLRPEAAAVPAGAGAPSGIPLHYVHSAIADAPGEHVCYNTTDPRTIRWVKAVLCGICEGIRADDAGQGGPILVHCRSGKDRTGVIVAALLLLVRPEVASEALERDYLRSDGKLDLEAFRRAVDGLKRHRATWTEGVDEKKMLRALLGGAAAGGVCIATKCFVSASLKVLLPLVNPGGVAAELGMEADEDLKAMEVTDEEERVELCRQLLPLTESGLAANQKSGDKADGRVKFLVARAACFEQLGFAALCGPAKDSHGGTLVEDLEADVELLRGPAGRGSVMASLRAAAEAWEHAENGAIGNVKKICQTHRERCYEAM